jgi:hypothetical protein
MVIDLVFEACKSLPVGTGLAHQHDGAAIRHEQPGPDQKHPVLPERDLAVIEADKLRSLRDEQVFPGRAVVDILGHLGGDLTGQIGAYPGDERRRNDCTGLDHIP